MPFIDLLLIDIPMPFIDIPMPFIDFLMPFIDRRRVVVAVVVDSFMLFIDCFMLFIFMLFIDFFMLFARRRSTALSMKESSYFRSLPASCNPPSLGSSALPRLHLHALHRLLHALRP